MKAATVFGPAYSGSYDRIYADKDYEAECAFIVEVHRRSGHGPLSAVIDLGCGTAGHVVPLARRGMRVTGVDRSPEMLRIAAEKLRAEGIRAELTQGDVRTYRGPGGYDVALFMFAVLGYQTRNEDVRAALATARSHVKEGGLLIFDVWYGPAVLTQGPGDRVRTIATSSGEIIRSVRPTLHAERNIVDVAIRTWRLDGPNVTERSDEMHEMRYFFLPELEEFLRAARFEVVSFTAFPHLDVPVTTSTWNVGCVARAIP